MAKASFEGIVQKIVGEKGAGIFLEPKKLKSLLMDYARNEYKGEVNLLLAMLDAGCVKVINDASDLAVCKKDLVEHLYDNYNQSRQKSDEMLVLLIFVLRGVKVPLFSGHAGGAPSANAPSAPAPVNNPGKANPSHSGQTGPIVIPKMFRDAVEKEEVELAELNRSIIKIKHDLDKLPGQISQAEKDAEHYKNEKSKMSSEFRDRQRAILGWNGGNIDWSELKSNHLYNLYKSSEVRAYEWKRQLGEWLNERNSQKLESELRKSDLESSLRKTAEQRAEEHYLALLEAKNSTDGEIGFAELAKKFREIEVYKDAGSLADECEDFALQAKYDRLVQEKNSGPTETQCEELARQFRNMNGYADTAKLAIECNKQYRELKERREEQERIERERITKERYDLLVEKKKNIRNMTDAQCRDLAREFRGMKGYADTAKLADECDDLAIRMVYELFVQEKDRAKTEDDFRKVAVKFHNMNGYADTKALAAACEASAQKARYDMLVQRLNSGTKDEDDYLNLARQFHGMIPYENTAELAKECEASAQKARYDMLVQRLNSGTKDEDDYRNLAKPFRGMVPYENTAKLAEECDAQALRMQYDRLARGKSKATTEEDYLNLARQFRDMNGYADTADLAKECEGMALKARYDQLVEAKSVACAENRYEQLASEFRSMIPYADSEAMASECDSQYLALKKRREDLREKQQAILARQEAAERRRQKNARRYGQFKSVAMKNTHIVLPALVCILFLVSGFTLDIDYSGLWLFAVIPTIMSFAIFRKAESSGAKIVATVALIIVNYNTVFRLAVLGAGGIGVIALILTAIAVISAWVKHRKDS